MNQPQKARAVTQDTHQPQARSELETPLNGARRRASRHSDGVTEEMYEHNMHLSEIPEDLVEARRREGVRSEAI